MIVTHGNGHMLELALRNALPDRDVVSVLTEVVVAADDPAFLKPSKPIGPVYSEAEAAAAAASSEAGRWAATATATAASSPRRSRTRSPRSAACAPWSTPARC